LFFEQRIGPVDGVLGTNNVKAGKFQSSMRSRIKGNHHDFEEMCGDDPI